jgi:predicted Na+-dependent transporter
MSEVGQAANTFMEAMKSQPLALALCVMNFALLALMYYQSKGFTEQRQQNITMFIEYQKEVQRALSTCGAPGPRSGSTTQEEPT